MRLDTHEGTLADPATPEDIARAVAGLHAIGDAFVVLNDDTDPDAYVQAAGTVGEDFIVEYQDGSTDEHYRGDRRATASELIVLLTRYLARDPDWGHAILWHHYDFEAASDPDRPSA